MTTSIELHHGERIDTMVSMLGTPSNEESCAADVGCNWGVHTFRLAELGYRTYAIDTYPRLFDEILVPISQLLGIRNRIEIYVGYGENLPYASGCFELIVCGEVIEHVKDPVIFLKEMNRILEDEGVLILSTPNGEADAKRIYDFLGLFANPDHENEYSLNELKGFLEEAGFKIVDTKYINPDIFPFVHLLNDRVMLYRRLIYTPVRALCVALPFLSKSLASGIVVKCNKIN
jgi:SAM-dependent methyltransferase